MSVDVDARAPPSTVRISWIAILDRLLVPSTIIIFFLMWEFLVRHFEVPQYLLPPPSAVLGSLGNMWSTGLLQQHAAVTLFEAVCGFSIALSAALICGILIAESRLFERVIYP
jgi:NitT/TauT family transport system permease protein